MREIVETQEEIENLYKTGSNAPYTELEKCYFGYLGVLLCHKQTGRVQCHICGNWYNSVSLHAAQAHKMKSKEYKIKFGFGVNFPLCSQAISAARRIAVEKRTDNWRNPSKALFERKKNKNWKKNISKGHYTASVLNQHNLCKDQLIRRVHVVADKIGRFPNFKQLQEYDISAWAAIRRRYGKWNTFKKLEFTDEPIREKDSLKYTKDILVTKIRDWVLKHQRIPTSRDFQKSGNNISTIRSYFGSWNRALNMAGFTKYY